MANAGINPKSVRHIFPKRKDKPFASVSVYPVNLFFDVQNPGEVIYIMMRKHFITNLPWIIKGVIFALVPFIILAVTDLIIIGGEKIIFESVFNQAGTAFWLVALAIFYSGIFSYLIGNYLNWYFNIYLLTNERVIHIHFRIFTGKIVSEAALEKIEDISQQIFGFFPSIFNYGDVFVQTAAEKSKFLFKSVSDPSWFRDVLGDLVSLIKKGEP